MAAQQNENISQIIGRSHAKDAGVMEGTLFALKLNLQTAIDCAASQDQLAGWVLAEIKKIDICLSRVGRTGV